MDAEAGDQPDHAALIADEALPPDYARTIAMGWVPLAARIAGWRRAAGRPIVVGINGAQGTGKTTLCRFVERILGDRYGLAAATLSLDDIYCTKSDRRRLAGAVHPLFAMRGVPGTHDLALGERTIDALLASTGPVPVAVPVPRFDKAIDDRSPRDGWPQVMAPVDVLLFEGWCIGATPMAESTLPAPVNRLEADEDAEMTWRLNINRQLAGPYAALFARLDHLVMLRAPDFAAVCRWRQRQENRLRAVAGTDAGMDDAALARFMAHYERLTLHMLAALPPRADIVFDLDGGQRIAATRGLD